MPAWKMMREELREMLWLASLVSALSVLGVGLAVILALAVDGWNAFSAATAGIV